MSELFEDEDDELIEPAEDIDPLEADVEGDLVTANLDARRRLEKALEDKRLRDELDDFLDY